MVCQKFGLSQVICNIFAETLKEMKYHMMTGLDLSKQYYCHSDAHAILEQAKETGPWPPSGYLQVSFLCGCSVGCIQE